MLMERWIERISVFTGFGVFFLVAMLAAVAAPEHASAQAQEAGWKKKWDGILSGAKKEERVVVAGPPGAEIRNLLTQRFREAFPNIELEYVAARGNELAAKIRSERSAGIYSLDVLLQGTTTALTYFKPLGALDPIPSALILPEVTDLKNWRDSKLEFADKEQQYNLVYAASVKVPVVFNESQARLEEVNGLYKLLDPKWKGKIVMNDPVPSGAGNVTFRFIWNVLGPEKAADYFKRMRAQIGAVDQDERRMVEWVALGKYAINLGPSDRMIPQLLNRGLKFGVVPEFVDYGSYLTPGPSSLVLINKRPHPNAAAVFVNWLLGKEGQKAWSEASGYISRRLDTPTDHLPPYVVPKRGGKYWSSYTENNINPSREEEKALQEIFGK